MSRKLSKIVAVVSLMLMGGVAGCNKFATDTRNAIAAASAFVISEQVTHQATCAANPKQAVCVAVNRGIDAVNLSIDALETYCGGVTFTGKGQCNPPAGTMGAQTKQLLQSQLSAMAQTLTDLKSATGK